MKTQSNHKKDEDAKFENDAVDPGFETSAEQPLKTRDDKFEGKKEKGDKLKDQVGEQENGKEDDAMNYKSDREHGAYNSKKS